MKEFFKKLRIAAYVTALLTIALGVVLVAWPMEVTGLICRVLGALLVVFCRGQGDSCDYGRAAVFAAGRMDFYYAWIGCYTGADCNRGRFARTQPAGFPDGVRGKAKRK